MSAKLDNNNPKVKASSLGWKHGVAGVVTAVGVAGAALAGLSWSLFDWQVCAA